MNARAVNYGLRLLLAGLVFATAPGQTACAAALRLSSIDALSRLTDASLGRLNATNTAIMDDPNVALRRDLGWTLDDLGNRVGDAAWPTDPNARPGFFRGDDLNGDGVVETATTYKVAHDVNLANEISQTLTSANGQNPPAAQTFVHDAAGNLVFDAQFFYQHDAFNRLLAASIDPGLNASTIDAAGRLVHATRPRPSGASDHPGVGGGIRDVSCARMLWMICPFRSPPRRNAWRFVIGVSVRSVRLSVSSLMIPPPAARHLPHSKKHMSDQMAYSAP